MGIEIRVVIVARGGEVEGCGVRVAGSDGGCGRGGHERGIGVPSRACGFVIRDL